MKKVDIAVSLSFIPADYLLLIAAGLTSYSLRFQGFVTGIRPVFFDFPLSEFLPSLLFIGIVGIFIFALTGSYRIAAQHRLGEVFTKVFLGVSTIVLFIIVTIFLRRELFSSRFVIVLAWAIAIMYVFLGRLLILKCKSLALRYGIGSHLLVVIGPEKTASNVESFVKEHPELGYRVIKKFRECTSDTFREIDEIHQRKAVDEILDAREANDENRNSIIQLINFSHERNITFRYIASLYQTKLINFEVDSIAGYPVIQVNKTPLDGWKRIYKRVIDVCIALLSLIVLSPFFIVVALAIRLTSRGPIFARLTRVGRGGRNFTLFKFRSMIENAEAMKREILQYNERPDGPLFKMRNDPRITPIGRILRRTSLDELPQLWNVFRGDMSLVGPRPHEPGEVKLYQNEYRLVLNVKPGITGLSQVSGRSNLIFAEEVRLDMYYLENWSLGLDLRILFKTLIVIFKFQDAA